MQKLITVIHKLKLKNYVSFLLVGAMLLYALVQKFNGTLLKSDADMFTSIGYNIILAVSLNLVVGFLGELSLGHAGFMCIGAYFGSYFAMQISQSMQSRLPVLCISMLFGGLLAALFGFFVGLPALRLKGDYLAIVTLAFGEIVRNLCKNMPFLGGALGLGTDNLLKIETRGNPILFIVSLSVALIMLFIVHNLVHSKHGRAITAIRDNEIAAKAMGVNVTFYKLFVFVVAAFFAGVAGVIYGHYVSPVKYDVFSYNYSIEILVMVVLGGMASINGSIIAATLITYMNIRLQDLFSGDRAAYKYLIYALILIVIVIFNNAPKLAPVKERISPKAALRRLRIKRNRPELVSDDAAEWNKIPTKIPMDELLSTDLQLADDGKPDKPTKGGR